MTTAPAIAPQIAHFFASSDAFWAWAYWPDCHRPFTLLALMIDTMPNGKQHNTVTRMPHTRLLSGCCAG